MSKDALEGYLLVLEDEKMSIPKPSTYQELQTKLNDNQQLQLINVDTDFIRRREENKAVNKMVTLPKWLVDLGKEKKVKLHGRKIKKKYLMRIANYRKEKC